MTAGHQCQQWGADPLAYEVTIKKRVDGLTEIHTDGTVIVTIKELPEYPNRFWCLVVPK